jgi:hypothetical protein
MARHATDGQGGWVTVWVTDDDPDETAGTDGDVVISRSADDGASWTSPTYLNLDARVDGQYNLDNQVFVATDGAGTWIAAWQRDNTSSGSDQDTLMARSEPICPLQRRNDCVGPTQSRNGKLTKSNEHDDGQDPI